MKYALINGHVYDGNKEGEIVDVTIKIEDGIIVGFDDCLDGYEVIDLKGQYVMPGLINLHIHIPGEGRASMKSRDKKKIVRLVEKLPPVARYAYHLCRENMKKSLYSGVTTVRSVGGIMDYDSRLKHELKDIGPRILCGDMAISVPDGHMAGSLAHIAHNPSEASHFVEAEAKKDIDLIKLMITGGVLDAKKKGEPGELKMSPEIIKAACDKAHQLGLPVAAHVESVVGLEAALRNGVDTIEHGAPISDELMAIMKERNAAHILTISPAVPFALFDPTVSGTSEKDHYNGKIVFDGNVEMAKRCLENDILVGLGTDTGCPYVSHTDMYREISYFMHYCHVSRPFALHTATMVNAKIAHIDTITGSIEIGKQADLLILKDNPIETLDALKEPSMVIFNGHRYVGNKVKRNPKIARQLDPYYHA